MALCVDCDIGCTGGCTSCSGTCTGTCKTTCKYGCQNTCYGCTGTCSGTCLGSCQGCTGCTSCTGRCTGTCDYPCQSSCVGGCTSCSGGCRTGCFDTCKGTCETGCYTGCKTGCKNTCTGTCSGGCLGCTGCSGTCTGGCTGCTGCSGTCKGSCTGGCTGCGGACSNSCTGTCSLTCVASCANDCSSTCTGSSTTPSVPGAPLLDERVEGGFTIYWRSSSGATSYTIRVRRGYDNYTKTYTTRYTSITITGLQYGVRYYLSVRANNANGSSDYSSENPCTTAPKTPTIEAYAVTNTSITIKVTGMINNWDKVEVYRYSSSGYYIDHKNVTTNGGTVTWDSLTAGTIYRFNAKSFFTVDSTLLESVNYSNTLEVTVSARPPNFQWDIPKVSGQPFQVTAIEWNKFTTRINDFRRYKGLSNYSFLTVEKGDTFYASTFNTAITAISAMNPPISPPSAVTPKSDILASYLNKIVESLNSIP